ncbi:MAG: hypothetical protein GAK38_01161 [Xylophilus sp.]|nr:MAG: hypothetical protein GAK38_01161 [Xylophilus sp.]
MPIARAEPTTVRVVLRGLVRDQDGDDAALLRAVGEGDRQTHG